MTVRPFVVGVALAAALTVVACALLATAPDNTHDRIRTHTNGATP